MFLIWSSSSRSFTVTLNSSVVLSPAFKFTSIPLANSSAELPVDEPFTFILPGINVVPVGMLSFTTTVAGAFPVLLSNVIIYVISLFAVTVLPASGIEDLLYFTSALFTVSVTSFVGLSSTKAVFNISLLKFAKSSPSNGFTVTSKLTVAVPTVAPSFAGTFTVIPAFKLSSVSCVGNPFTFILPATNVVPAGSSSLTTTFLSKPPSFVTVIVYVIFSPSTT